MKKLALIFVALISFALSNTLNAEEVKIENLVLNLPEGYSGPVTQERGETKLLGFIKPHKGKETNSLIQFSIIDLEKAPPDFRAKYGVKTDKELLMGFLKGIERRRTSFSYSNYSEITIAGVPANRIEWTGYANDMKLEGIYYTLVSNYKVFAISLQDIAPYTKQNLPVMKKAIENIRK
jgi:hypothetical protein